MSLVTAYLRDGYMGDLTTLRVLQMLAGLDTPEAARACRVSPETYRRWRTDRPANPTAVRLMAVLAGYVPWPGWEGWEVHGGRLYAPGYQRQGLGPGDLLSLPFLYQLIGEYRRQAQGADRARLDRVLAEHGPTELLKGA